MEPREIIQKIEESASLPVGKGDRFAGYAVIGLPFRSGHVLALRRFPASSLGRGYTSVWHRSPAGNWTFYSTVLPEQGCARYFGAEIQRNIIAPIELVWNGPAKLCVKIGDTLNWQMTLSESPLSRLMNGVSRLVPAPWWQTNSVLKMMGHAARIGLGTGKLNLRGRTPNGHDFTANPQRIWLIDSSRAVVNDIDVGPVGALPQQASLNEFLIPQRGIFAVARAFLEAPKGASTQISEAAWSLSSGSHGGSRCGRT
ncbi:MAG TPA: hypothetical protein VFF31_17340 [Blastocatellia bacterium]|nr:hypothetical protein [Blastocatellia bacterium]